MKYISLLFALLITIPSLALAAGQEDRPAVSSKRRLTRNNTSRLFQTPRTAPQNSLSNHSERMETARNLRKFSTNWERVYQTHQEQQKQNRTHREKNTSAKKKRLDDRKSAASTLQKEAEGNDSQTISFSEKDLKEKRDTLPWSSLEELSNMLCGKDFDRSSLRKRRQWRSCNGDHESEEPQINQRETRDHSSWSSLEELIEALYEGDHEHESEEPQINQRETRDHSSGSAVFERSIVDSRQENPLEDLTTTYPKLENGRISF